MSRELAALLRTRRAARKAGEETRTSKFIVGPYDVKVRFPTGAIRERIDELLARFPAGSPLEVVEAALAEEGASFAPWLDGEPGDSGAYFSGAETKLLQGFPLPRTTEQAGALLAGLVENAVLMTAEEKRDPRWRAVRNQFTAWDWERVVAVAVCTQVSSRAEASRRRILEAHREGELRAIDKRWE